MPPFLSPSGFAVQGLVPACTLATVHFMLEGADQTVKMNLSGTLAASATAFSPWTTGFCLAQLAS